jgi:hypothetical protein
VYPRTDQPTHGDTAHTVSQISTAGCATTRGAVNRTFVALYSVALHSLFHIVNEAHDHVGVTAQSPG